VGNDAAPDDALFLVRRTLHVRPAVRDVDLRHADHLRNRRVRARQGRLELGDGGGRGERRRQGDSKGEGECAFRHGPSPSFARKGGFYFANGQGSSSRPSPRMTQRPPTLTAAPRTSTSMRLGRPISSPCSTTKGIPSGTRPREARYAPSGPAALPVAGSSSMSTPGKKARACATEPFSRVSRQY